MSYIKVERERALFEKMARLGIRREEIRERFIRAQGPGGQNVNKTSTCVYLKHLPTGVEVKCQQERSQAQNRLVGREILVNKIEKLVSKKLAKEAYEREKLRRKQRKRAKQTKEIILEEKRRRSQKKMLRRKLRIIDV